MRRFLSIVLLILLLTPACSYISKQATPMHMYTAHDIASEGRYVAETVSETRYGFRLFTIPLSIPEPIDMAEDLVRHNDAKGLTDLEVEMSELFSPYSMPVPTNVGSMLSFIFQIPKITVKGRLVR